MASEHIVDGFPSCGACGKLSRARRQQRHCTTLGRSAEWRRSETKTSQELQHKGRGLLVSYSAHSEQYCNISLSHEGLCAMPLAAIELDQAFGHSLHAASDKVSFEANTGEVFV